MVALSVDDEATTSEFVRRSTASRSRSDIPPTPVLPRKRRARSSIPSVGSSNPPASCCNPDGQVVVSVYSSGAIGRLVPDDVVGLIRYLRDHAPATDSGDKA